MKRRAPAPPLFLSKFVGPLLAAGLLLCSAQAHAQWEFSIGSFELFGQEISIELTDTFKYTYHLEDELGAHSSPVVVNNKRENVLRLEHQVLNTLDLAVSSGAFRLGARMDLNIFEGLASDEHCPGAFWCNQEEEGRRYQDTFALERIYLTISKEAFTVTLGDFYACLGKGMALSATKQSELGLDNAIRGGRFSLHHGPVEFTMLGGEFNPLDIDEAEGWTAPWRAEPVLAARLEYRIAEMVALGAHGVFIMRDCGKLCETDARGTSKTKEDRDLVGGFSVDVPDLLDGQLAFSGEVNLQQTIKNDGVFRGILGEQGDGSDPQYKGIGAYATATGSIADLNLTLEYKYYSGFELAAPKSRDQSYVLAYHQPPTLEWIRAEIGNNSSVSGARLRADYNFGELGPVELTAFINYGYFQNWQDNDDHGAHDVHNPYGGVELDYLEGEGHTDVTVGLRREYNHEQDHVFHQDIFVELNAEQLLVANHSLKLSLVVMVREKWDAYETPLVPVGDELGDPIIKEWNEVELTLDYRFSPWMSLTFSYERNSSQEGRENYFGGGGRFYINPGTYLEVWGGQNKPGIKCRNGACRWYPAFSGVKVIGVVRM